MFENHTPSAAARKAESLRARLVKRYAGHEAAPMISVTVEDGACGREVELYVFSDVVPSLKVRGTLNLWTDARYRFEAACGKIDAALAVEAERQRRDAEWLAACAAMSH